MFLLVDSELIFTQEYQVLKKNCLKQFKKIKIHIWVEANFFLELPL